MLLGECILFRNGIGRPPILFEQYHVGNYLVLSSIQKTYLSTVRSFRMKYLNIFLILTKYKISLRTKYYLS